LAATLGGTGEPDPVAAAGGSGLTTIGASAHKGTTGVTGAACMLADFFGW
jgi:hypothetical protein